MMKRLQRSGFLVLCVLACSEPLYAVEIVAGPCLEAATESSMTVMWITDKGCTSWVEYGTDASLGQKAVHSRHGLIDAGETVHKITLEGLAPDTTYHYKICSREVIEVKGIDVDYGLDVAGDVSTFTTLDDQKDSISFLVLNDIHARNEAFTGLLQSAADTPYDMVFLNGDFLSQVKDEAQLIKHVVNPCTENFARRIPVYYVRGNHETRGPFARMLGEYFTVSGDRFYGSFDHGPVHFIVLDSGEDKVDSHWEYGGLADFDRYRDKQRRWLENEIQTEAFRSAPFRVLIMHMPLDTGQHGRQACLEKWGPLLEQGGVDLMLNGHIHRYHMIDPVAGERSYPAINGGGPRKDGTGFDTLIRVDASPKRLQVRITKLDGTVLDTYTVDKTAAAIQVP